MNKIYLSVDYENRSLAKNNGGKWDSEKRKWYVVDVVPDELKDYIVEDTTPRIVEEVKKLIEDNLKRIPVDDPRYALNRQNYEWMILQDISRLVKDTDDGRVVSGDRAYYVLSILITSSPLYDLSKLQKKLEEEQRKTAELSEKVMYMNGRIWQMGSRLQDFESAEEKREARRRYKKNVAARTEKNLDANKGEENEHRQLL